MKTKQRASADVGFMMVAYNLKRLINILGIRALMHYLDRIIVQLWAIIAPLHPIIRVLGVFMQIKCNEIKNIGFERKSKYLTFIPVNPMGF